jgi:hypothetical protein
MNRKPKVLKILIFLYQKTITLIKMINQYDKVVKIEIMWLELIENKLAISPIGNRIKYGCHLLKFANRFTLGNLHHSASGV